MGLIRPMSRVLGVANIHLRPWTCDLDMARTRRSMNLGAGSSCTDRYSWSSMRGVIIRLKRRFGCRFKWISCQWRRFDTWFWQVSVWEKLLASKRNQPIHTHNQEIMKRILYQYAYSLSHQPFHPLLFEHLKLFTWFRLLKTWSRGFDGLGLILRCHPWSKIGKDPVPDHFSLNEIHK